MADRQSINDDCLLATAAASSSSGLLAYSPLSPHWRRPYGLFADVSTIGANLQTLARDVAVRLVPDRAGPDRARARQGRPALGATFRFGLALAIWSANAGVKAMIEASNVVYGEREKRSFFRLNLLSLAFTIGAIAGAAADGQRGGGVAAGARSSRPRAGQKTIVSLARWPLMFAILLLALGVLYRFGPSRGGAMAMAQCRHAGRGLLWIAGSVLLSWYLSNFGNYDATYGSLGAAIGLMMWMWMSAIIVLCGAELNRKSSTRPPGVRRSGGRSRSVPAAP